MKLIDEYKGTGVVVLEGGEEPCAIVPLSTIRSVVTSLHDAQQCVARFSDREATVSLEIIRDKLGPILTSLEYAAKGLGVEIQIANLEFDYETAERELAEAIAALEALHGSSGPDATE